MIDKILIDKSVLQQTLAALEDADTYVHAADLEPAIDALRAALAAPQRQPRPFVECEDSQAGQSQVLQPEQPAQPLIDAVAELLGHISDVFDDVEFEKIETKLWNDVSVFVGLYRYHTSPPPAQQPLTESQYIAALGPLRMPC